MPIVQQGSLNTTALVVPDLYVQIVPPQNLVLNGVPTNVVGIVGSAGWGPVNEPVVVATMADYAATFGTVVKPQAGANMALLSTGLAVDKSSSSFVEPQEGTDLGNMGTNPLPNLAGVSKYQNNPAQITKVQD